MNLLLKKLEFHRSAEDVANDYTYLTEHDKEKIVNIDTKATFDFENEYVNYTCYYLIDGVEWEKYKKVLDDNLISYICNDITESVLLNKINLEKVLFKYTYKDNIEEFDDFIKTVNEWISNNLDLDTILDMINERGVESLRKVDKEFLKKI